MYDRFLVVFLFGFSPSLNYLELCVSRQTNIFSLLIISTFNCSILFRDIMQHGCAENAI